ncbi:hypothetical protein GC209_04345 [bacterium]|nr:hypothetical protein [bacterium]
MRPMILVLMLSACSAYPHVDWPAGAPTAPRPALVPQAEVLGSGPVAQDRGPPLVARAAALRAWAGSVAP